MKNIYLKRRSDVDALADLREVSPAFKKYTRMSTGDLCVVIDETLDNSKTVEELSDIVQIYSARSDAYTASLLSDKAAKNAEIDARTQEIISGGFTFDGHVFSLSIRAQTNWLGLLTLKDLFAWPCNVTTDDDLQYSLALANLIPFIGTGSGTVASAISSGRALKLQVNAAETLEEIDAVTDSR